jgi:hypothetical protein
MNGREGVIISKDHNNEDKRWLVYIQKRNELTDFYGSVHMDNLQHAGQLESIEDFVYLVSALSHAHQYLEVLERDM